MPAAVAAAGAATATRAASPKLPKILTMVTRKNAQPNKYHIKTNSPKEAVACCKRAPRGTTPGSAHFGNFRTSTETTNTVVKEVKILYCGIHFSTLLSLDAYRRPRSSLVLNTKKKARRYVQFVEQKKKTTFPLTPIPHSQRSKRIKKNRETPQYFFRYYLGNFVRGNWPHLRGREHSNLASCSFTSARFSKLRFNSAQ